MSRFKLEIDKNRQLYSLSGSRGEEGPIVEWGQPAPVAIGDAIYYAISEDPIEDPPKVCKVVSVSVHAVDYELAELGEDDSDQDDDDEDTGPLLVGEEPPPAT